MVRRSRPNAGNSRRSGPDFGPGSGRFAAEFARLPRAAPAWLAVGGVLGAVLAGLLGALATWAEVSHRTAAEASGLAGGTFGGASTTAWLEAPAGLAIVVLSFALFGVGTAWLIVADVRERRLPNTVVLWATAALVVPLSAVSLLWGIPGELALSWAAALTFAAVALGAWLLWPAHVGAGDVKLTPATAFLPAWMQPEAVWFLLPVWLMGALTVAGVIALLRRSRDLAFGPVLLVASWGAALTSPMLAGPLLTGPLLAGPLISG
ncbi:Flp pilus assembly protein protease CpaA [Leucobacter exalbidus]|uniref:Flp pilus assembly protein protease CpaA n=1 Tax=Leucobacter exalbidus TaxID=662960 RepID=A0A940T4U9_9MICO|nr:hypothetical protein [Leucobacter exalbidus]MBP1327617.1 Flp pilus assembly protein protease CpaA [Leucobacter exalbidus]